MCIVKHESSPIGVTDWALAYVLGRKGNEIKAAPKLLQQLDLRQRVVSGDAMFTQRQLSVQIMAQDDSFIDWPGLQQVFKVERRVTTLRTGKSTYSVVFH